ncbi:hypothetical protein B296_00032360 [Ensete ventricosum]|uniref:Uncharacterized protein n=1 Tax=Ensete ventricosum TaxID=4639 RepID=A0A427ADU0_ENSVE|nr:hypothetical protein B296_00032360 [Ensete ventricosum]
MASNFNRKRKSHELRNHIEIVKKKRKKKKGSGAVDGRRKTSSAFWPMVCRLHSAIHTWVPPCLAPWEQAMS